VSGEATYTLADFGVQRLWRGQTRLLTSRRRNVLFGGGLACGKSMAGALKAILLALENPGVTGWVVAQTKTVHQENLLPLTQQFLDDFAHLHRYSLVKKERETPYHLIELLNGGRILFVGESFATSNRGPSIAWAVVDEGTKLRNWPRVFTEIQGRVRGERNHHEQIVHLSNLDFGATSVIKTFVELTQQGDPSFDLILAPTRENLSLSYVYISDKRKTMSRAEAAAMLDAMIIRPAVLIWPEFSRQRHLLKWPKREGFPWGIGVDWGYRPACVVGQFFALSNGTAYHPDDAPEGSTDCIIVVDEIAKDYNSDTKFHADIETLVKRWRTMTGEDATLVASDRAEPDNNALLHRLFPHRRTRLWYAKRRDEQQIAQGVKLIRGALDPAEGPVALYFATALATAPGSQERGVIKSVESWKWKVNAAGDIEVGVPMKSTPWEHAADALRYLVMGRWYKSAHVWVGPG